MLWNIFSLDAEQNCSKEKRILAAFSILVVGETATNLSLGMPAQQSSAYTHLSTRLEAHLAVGNCNKMYFQCQVPRKRKECAEKLTFVQF